MKHWKDNNEYITSEGYRVIEYEDGYTTTFSPEGVWLL